MEAGTTQLAVEGAEVCAGLNAVVIGPDPARVAGAPLLLLEVKPPRSKPELPRQDPLLGPSLQGPRGPVTGPEEHARQKKSARDRYACEAASP